MKFHWSLTNVYSIVGHHVLVVVQSVLNVVPVLSVTEKPLQKTTTTTIEQNQYVKTPQPLDESRRLS